jgi:CubicO group peptidase (beta-lactamase class C family)
MANDARKKITTSDLLHMNSGLAWEESYDKICDATQMLFQAEYGSCSIGGRHMSPIHWNYSSGTTNLFLIKKSV